jgi:hypothetical protein
MASTSRLAKVKRIDTLAAADELSVADLPQAGSSPAIDLQRRLGEAALRGFYVGETTRQDGRAKRFVVAGGVAIISWTFIFWVGSLVIG